MQRLVDAMVGEPRQPKKKNRPKRGTVQYPRRGTRDVQLYLVNNFTTAKSTPNDNSEWFVPKSSIGAVIYTSPSWSLFAA